VPTTKTKPTTGIGTVLFDLETNGLLNDATHIHCIVLHHLETGETYTYNDESPGKGMSAPVHNGLTTLQLADTIVGHNIINFDIPVIKSIYPFFSYTGRVIDTLVLSRCYHPNLLDIDKNTKKIPERLYGRHSLEAYGYRLDELKGDYGKTTDWKEWSQELEDYCIQDVVVTKKLCEHFYPYLNGSY
tara:strand:+ start:262 stop:822 length:561 start_codon:yes stop_codon:yes gene_type:complete